MRTVGATLLAILALTAGARADTSPFTGYRTYQGLRWQEQLVETRHALTAPGNFINAPLPATVATNMIDGPAAVAAIVQDSANDYINTTSYSAAINVLSADAPLTPVRLWKPSWTTVPGYAQTLAQVMAQGVPIPAGYVPPGDSDDSAVFYVPGRDQEWEFWRLRPCDPASNAGFAWCAQWGWRMSRVSTNPGHSVNRLNGATYPNLPADPAKAATFETTDWGSTATHLPLLDLEITGEDVRAGVIGHAVGFAMDAKFIGGGRNVWPANAYDTNSTGGTVREGARFRLPWNEDCGVPAHLLGRMICAAVRDYGMVLDDRAGCLCFRATPDVRGMMDSAPSSQLDGFPYGDLQELAVGSDASPDPLG